ncbi:dihydrodipicolinate synthase family protein [Devosia rhodophyticola]|uniref:Dihydrodipicolinate synthase family protein n=1 Tax=Devosia rhodophyticola TaxID=3026423 RepID=A0ABY7YZ01_9HYPH|nr:dihydrodipicolinate synthase family protein [Devosia rhodophyticola]WDR06472.1 dihydrodipicolinate synthase family protein [Devosia rhodophyticola]
MTVNWQGVIPALMTEMKQGGALDMQATARHVESCLDAGCEGFIMLGTLGENSSLSPDEKETVVRTAVEAANGRAPVIAGVAEYTTDLAIDTAKRLQKAGAVGVMALPTMVYQQDAREAVEHFKALSNAVDLPMMIYNNHVAYKLDLLPEDFIELTGQENIVAVKESSHDSRRMTDMINVLGDRFMLFCGVDDLMLENVLFGAKGWVSGMTNSFPRESVQMYKLAKAGRIEEALEIYRWFMPMLHLDTAVKLVQYIKLANQMAGEGAEWVRGPRLTLVGEERARIEKIIQTALDNRPQLKPLA